MEFQTCWPRESTLGPHATYSGHITACGLNVYSALPTYDSHIGDVMCSECQSSLSNAIESENN